jgi:hypothetical protein
MLAGLGFCSLFSSGSGLFCLVAAVVVAAVFRAGWRQVAALAAISAVLLFTYLKCNAEGTHADFSYFWKEPRLSAKCFFAFLGAPGLRYHVWPADRQFWTFDGWVAVSRGMAVFLLGTLLCLREWLRPAERTRFAVFHVFLIVLVFGTALAVVPSRLKLAVYEGVNVKYTNTVLLAWIAILSLGLKQLAEAGILSRPQRQAAWIAALAAALTLVLPAHFREIQVWRQWTNHLWESESMLVAGIYDEQLMKTLDWRPQELYDVLQNEYRGKRWSVFSRYPFDIGDPLQRHYEVAQSYACRGDFDGAAVPTAAGPHAGVMLTGWAWDETRRQPFHDIIFTDDADRIVGIAHSNRERDDVVRYFNDSTRLRSGWFGCARQSPSAPLRAYGLIPGTGKVCPICRRAGVGQAVGWDGRAQRPLDGERSVFGGTFGVYSSSRNDAMTVAVGFNPRITVSPLCSVRRVATIENQPSLRDGEKHRHTANSGLKPTATIGGRYATKCAVRLGHHVPMVGLTYFHAR